MYASTSILYLRVYRLCPSPSIPLIRLCTNDSFPVWAQCRATVCQLLQASPRFSLTWLLPLSFIASLPPSFSLSVCPYQCLSSPPSRLLSLSFASSLCIATPSSMPSFSYLSLVESYHSSFAQFYISPSSFFITFGGFPNRNICQTLPHCSNDF